MTETGEAVEPRPTRPTPRRRFIGPFGAGQVIAVLVVVVVSAVVLAAVTTPLATPTDPALPAPGATSYIVGQPTEGLRPGSLAPELEVDLGGGETFGLSDLAGQPIRLADLRGKAVWMNFWATWCPPCQAETPILREIAAEYADRGLVVVAVDVQETVDQARAYADRYQLDFPIGADVAGHIFRLYQAFALPTQFFIGPDGVVRTVLASPLTLEQARAQVEAILPETTLSPSPSAGSSPSP
jgi:cytochrome c biogenesis protein CcmG/thiol:disulfide interchange protein DsbE